MPKEIVAEAPEAALGPNTTREQLLRAVKLLALGLGWLLGLVLVNLYLCEEQGICRWCERQWCGWRVLRRVRRVVDPLAA